MIAKWSNPCKYFLFVFSLLITIDCVQPKIYPMHKADQFHFGELKNKKIAFGNIQQIELDEKAEKIATHSFGGASEFSAHARQIIFDNWIQQLSNNSVSLKSNIYNEIKIEPQSNKSRVNFFLDRINFKNIDAALMNERKGFQPEYLIVPVKLEIQYELRPALLFPIVKHSPVGRLEVVVLDLKNKTILWNGVSSARVSTTLDERSDLNRLLEGISTNLIGYTK